MNTDVVIEQLKAYAPIFNGNVAGGAEWELAKDQVWLPQPAAYVIPASLEATPNGNSTGLRQTLTETIAIIVDMDNSVDRRGQTQSSNAIGPMLQALFAAVLNWRPNDNHPELVSPGVNATRGYAFVSAEYRDSSRARLIWQFDFAIETFISDFDGFQIPSAPLTDVRITGTDQTTGTPLGVFDAPLPQT